MFTQNGATTAQREGAKLKSTCVRVAIVIALLAAGSVSQAGTVYTGEITIDSGDLLAPDVDAVTNQWNQSGVKLSWTITDNMDGTWHYQYIFDHDDLDPNTSHMIFDISANVDDVELILNATGGTPKLEQGGGNSNPGLPGDFDNPLKFDETDFNITTIDFDIARMPTWGDFYAKGGSTQGQGNNFGAAWNSGFLADDPLVGDHPLDDGPLVLEGLAHILVPDSITTPPDEFPDPSTDPLVPEPGAAMLALLGLMGLAITRRRSSRRRA